jgi:arsenite methyltransferase
MAVQPDYGVDAPGVIRNLAVVSAIGVAVALFAPPVVHLGPVESGLRPTGWGAAIGCGTGALLMLLYSKIGKFYHRDRMLKLHNWRGDEQVLDVGTGRGLLLVGAVRRLRSGHGTGLDVWNKEDLSGNSLARTEQNLIAEGVAEKCSLVSEGAQKMSFANESFDVILSNLCLHNIYDKPSRLEACREIVRVLKPGGVAIISDFKHTGEYEKTMREAGAQVERKLPSPLTFPPLRIVLARKG